MTDSIGWCMDLIRMVTYATERTSREAINPHGAEKIPLADRK
jgi:hypothetical protein